MYSYVGMDHNSEEIQQLNHWDFLFHSTCLQSYSCFVRLTRYVGCLHGRLIESKAETCEQQVIASEMKKEVSRLEAERNERQRCLKDLAAQYDKDSQQLTDVRRISFLCPWHHSLVT